MPIARYRVSSPSESMEDIMIHDVSQRGFSSTVGTLSTMIVVAFLSSTFSACTLATPQDELSSDDLDDASDHPEELETSDACFPVCDAVGTRSEGWYDSCSGELYVWAGCDGCEAECLYPGTRAEGWYDTCGVGADGTGLILWADCD